MIPRSLKKLTQELSYALRIELEEYVESIDPVLPVIFAEAQVEETLENVNAFLFAAGVRRLWALVDSQFRILESALTLAARNGLGAFQFGSTIYSRSSPAYFEIKSLREALRGRLQSAGLSSILQARTLAEMLHMLEVT